MTYLTGIVNRPKGLNTYGMSNFGQSGATGPVLILAKTDVYNAAGPMGGKVIGQLGPGTVVKYLWSITNPLNGEVWIAISQNVVSWIKGSLNVVVEKDLTRINIKATKTADVRSGPSTDFPVISTLAAGSMQVAYQEFGSFFRINTTQWVLKSAFELSGPPGEPHPFNWTYIILAGGLTIAIASALGVRAMIKRKKSKK